MALLLFAGIVFGISSCGDEDLVFPGMPAPTSTPLPTATATPTMTNNGDGSGAAESDAGRVGFLDGA